MDPHFNNDGPFSPHHHQAFASMNQTQNHTSQSSQPSSSHTLPPLPAQPIATYSNGFFAQTSRPLQPSFSSNMDPFHQNTQAFGRYNSTAYAQSLQQYSGAPNFLPQQMSVSNYSQFQSMDSSQGRLPDTLPMPFGAQPQPYLPTTSHSSYQPFSAPVSMLGQAAVSNPTHVVGSQGRRGILPSAEGRPAALPNTGTIPTKSSATPSKDADGKYPCLHCNKTYLHAKHLKRHMLRHTGDRPYSCHLCHDTFSRSDILKRHFQKCSIRRGNPTGASHLAYSQTHTRKAQLRKSSASELDGTNGTGPSPALVPNTDKSFNGTENTGLGISNFSEGHQSLSTPISRSNSMKGLGKDVGLRNRRSLPGPGPPTYSGASYPFSAGQISPASISTSGASTPLEMQGQRSSCQFAPAAHPDLRNSRPNSYLSDVNAMSSMAANQRNGHYASMLDSAHNQGNSFDFSGAFQTGGRDSYMNSPFPSTAEDHLEIKVESQETLNGYYDTALE